MHAKVNSMGFIETPYRDVVNGKVDMSGTAHYLTAEDEDNCYIAQANAPLKGSGEFVNKLVKTRFEGDFPIVKGKEIRYMDIAPNQIVSVAASLIPFLEHDDANRALMGSNMMRQAVPLMRPEAPIVGTGIESRVARESRSTIVAEGRGKVTFVDSLRIEIVYNLNDDEKLVSFEEYDNLKTYDLVKFRRSNQDTCINIVPIVKIGDKVTKGQVLCEGFATANGELALGRNLKVAFMPWQGYNFEDAIVISEKVVRNDIFTSLHIEEFKLEVRDTKRGEEEFTPEIPNVSDEAVKDLDENGIVRIGASVKDLKLRNSRITWLNDQWIYDLLFPLVKSLNTLDILLQ